MKTNPYIYFDGGCREAFALYEKLLGAKVISLLTYADGPEPNPGMMDKVMHGRIDVGGTIIMASDAPADRYSKPAGFTLNADTKSIEEAERVFAGLSEGGTVMMPLGETFWATRFGMAVDRFGIPWMVNFEKQAA